MDQNDLRSRTQKRVRKPLPRTYTPQLRAGDVVVTTRALVAWPERMPGDVLSGTPRPIPSYSTRGGIFVAPTKKAVAIVYLVRFTLNDGDRVWAWVREDDLTLARNEDDTPVPYEAVFDVSPGGLPLVREGDDSCVPRD